MLNVQKFLLAQKEQGLSNAQAFEQLTEQFAIKVKLFSVFFVDVIVISV